MGDFSAGDTGRGKNVAHELTSSKQKRSTSSEGDFERTQFSDLHLHNFATVSQMVLGIIFFLK